jgi:hypothetical protein
MGWNMNHEENFIRACQEIDQTLKSLLALADQLQLPLVAARLQMTRDAVAEQVSLWPPLTFSDSETSSH